MAKQDGPIILRRTIDNLCFYISEGVALVRKKPELTRKQMMNSKRFRRTMESAGRMRRGSKIASKIYGALPEGWKDFCMYRVMTGEAVRLVKAGKTDEEAYNILWERYLAEFEPGYKEEQEFVYRDFIKPVFAPLQPGYRIEKKPGQWNKKKHELRSRSKKKLNKAGAVNRCYEAMDG